MKTINVLQFICPTGFYGAERWVLALANNLDPSKVRCDLAVTKESQSQDLEIYHQFPKDIGEAFEVPLNGRFDFSAISKLCQLIKERNIDIIHTHGYKSDILGVIAAKRCGIKAISTPHGFGEAKDFKLKFYIKVGFYFLRLFDKIIPLSKQLLDEVSRFGVSKDKLLYIQNGVDLSEIDKFHKKDNDGFPEQTAKKTIGFIGQMIPRKKITHILDIFNLLWVKNHNINLILLGDGEQREGLEKYARTLPSSADIKFLGFRKDRLEQLGNFDLFVMTSSSEGIPRCLMEAMAMEIPVAAYEIPGIDQLITHNQTGLLASYGDKEKLSSYWERLLNDKPYAKSLTAAGRDFVLNNFSAKRMANEYSDIFTSLIK